MGRIVEHFVLVMAVERMCLQVWGWAEEGRSVNHQGQVAICCLEPRQ
jgi:hypothetical protein